METQEQIVSSEENQTGKSDAKENFDLFDFLALPWLSVQ